MDDDGLASDENIFTECTVRAILSSPKYASLSLYERIHLIFIFLQLHTSPLL